MIRSSSLVLGALALVLALTGGAVAQHAVTPPPPAEPAEPLAPAPEPTASDVDAVAAQIAGGELTIWDGVYTEQQAAAGKPVYTQSCQTCHGITGRGGPGTPGVTGANLNRIWADTTLDGYYSFAYGNMPPGAAGKVGSAQDYANVIAYILQMHGAPAGDVMLTPNLDQLANIVIVRKPAS